MCRRSRVRSKDSETTEDLLVQVCRLHHARARSALHGLGLYRGQPPLLAALHIEEGQTQSDLAERLHVTQATMTKMLQRMEKAGWVRRAPDTNDQRIMRVYLTDAGNAVLGKMAHTMKTIDERATQGFTMEERVLFRRFLQDVRDNLSNPVSDTE